LNQTFEFKSKSISSGIENQRRKSKSLKKKRKKGKKKNMALSGFRFLPRPVTQALSSPSLLFPSPLSQLISSAQNALTSQSIFMGYFISLFFSFSFILSFFFFVQFQFC